LAARKVIDRIEREASKHRISPSKMESVNAAISRRLDGGHTSLSSLKAVQSALREESLDLMDVLTVGKIASSGGALSLRVGFSEDGEYAPTEIRNAELEIEWENGDIHGAVMAKIVPNG
jgi:hypothetical protein